MQKYCPKHKRGLIGVSVFSCVAHAKTIGAFAPRAPFAYSHLIKAPKVRIRLRNLHELGHIAEHNHSDDSGALLTQVMPHLKEMKNRLIAWRNCTLKSNKRTVK